MTTRPVRPLLLVTLVLVAAPAHAVENGFEAESCAWPEVVRIFSGWGVVHDFDGPEKVECTGVYMGGQTVLTASQCVNLQPTSYEVHFSDVFGAGPDSTSRLRMTIPLDDCRLHPVLPVAACRLRDQPIMQAIPIIAPCEADELLVAGAEIFVVGANIEKRWAHATLDADVPPASTEFQLLDTVWTTQTELSSQILEARDLGAPLYVRAPEGTLRIAGITVGTEPGTWIGTWNLIDWLLEAEPQQIVLPCHSLAGAWAPSPACATLITNRSAGAGAWGRGPIVCETPQIAAPTPTCMP